jgi:cobalamin biosynthesis protein CobD/CbiB
VCLLDVAVGDPRWFRHPVRLMGKVIEIYEQTWSGNHLARVVGVAALGDSRFPQRSQQFMQ